MPEGKTEQSFDIKLSPKLKPLRGMPSKMNFGIETSEDGQQILMLTAAGINGSTRDYKEVGCFTEKDLASISVPKLLAFCTNACNSLLIDLMLDFGADPAPEWITPIVSK